MSYTESDVIEHIYIEVLDNKSPMYHIIKELIRWYESKKITAEVNDWNTNELEAKLKKLRNML